MFISYAEQLQHPFWQRRRLEIMERDNFKCLDCHSGVVTLNVHHKYYIDGLMAWEYEDDMLETLCKFCHLKRHNKNLSTQTGVQSIGDILHEPVHGSLLEKLRKESLGLNNKAVEFNYDTVYQFWLKFVTKLTMERKHELVNAFILCRRQLLSSYSFSVTPLDNSHLPIIEANIVDAIDYACDYFQTIVNIKVTANESKKLA